MRSSNWLPWLLLAPLLMAPLAGLLYQLTGLGIFATLAQGALGMALVVMGAAFIANFRASQGRQQNPVSDSVSLPRKDDAHNTSVPKLP